MFVIQPNSDLGQRMQFVEEVTAELRFEGRTGVKPSVRSGASAKTQKSEKRDSGAAGAGV